MTDRFLLRTQKHPCPCGQIYVSFANNVSKSGTHTGGAGRERGKIALTGALLAAALGPPSLAPVTTPTRDLSERRHSYCRHGHGKQQHGVGCPEWHLGEAGWD